MKRQEFIALTIKEYLSGDKHALMGLIDWVSTDLGYSHERIFAIAKRRFGFTPANMILVYGDLFE